VSAFNRNNATSLICPFRVTSRDTFFDLVFTTTSDFASFSITNASTDTNDLLDNQLNHQLYHPSDKYAAHIIE
jgi:hypothetical protein